MPSSQFAHVNAAPVRVAPPSATNMPVFAFCAVCQLPEWDASAQVAEQMTSMRTAMITL